MCFLRFCRLQRVRCFAERQVPAGKVCRRTQTPFDIGRDVSFGNPAFDRNTRMRPAEISHSPAHLIAITASPRVELSAPHP